MNKVLPLLWGYYQKINFSHKTPNLVQVFLIVFNLILFVSFASLAFSPTRKITEALVFPLIPLKPLEETKVESSNWSGKQVFGFAPFWTFDKLDGVDLKTLTTLAYFSIPVQADGSLDRFDPGYQTFISKKATKLFKEAHADKTQVVLTVTQMDNGTILSLLDNPEAQTQAISEIVNTVQRRGIDGINVDLEYNGDPGEGYRAKFTAFVRNLTQSMHRVNPHSQVTVSVYAASVKEPKIYDIKSLAEVSDSIFMMAYDFAHLGADEAMPTSPLYGYKEGKYWYDVSSAVDDFLTQMPAEKLILGVPWYGYNYLVYKPQVLAKTSPNYGWGGPVVQTYAGASDNIHPDREDISDIQTGWDDIGKVGWKAYFSSAVNSWRMIFLEDPRSLGMKYDFAKDKKLAGVGIWALGFEEGNKEIWDQLKEKFGQKLLGERRK